MGVNTAIETPNDAREGAAKTRLIISPWVLIWRSRHCPR